MVILILALIFALLISTFALQNSAPVTIQLFWLTKDVPLVLIILGSAFVGALIMLFLAFWRELRLKRKTRLNNLHSIKDAPSDLPSTQSGLSDKESIDTNLDH